MNRQMSKKNTQKKYTKKLMGSVLFICIMLVLAGCGKGSSDSGNKVVTRDEIVSQGDDSGGDSGDLEDDPEDDPEDEDDGTEIMLLEENQIEVDGVIYEIMDDKDEVMVYYYQGSDSELKIPSEVTDSDTGEKYTVTKISETAFGQNGGEYLESVELPDTVKVIEKDAFVYCENLKSIVMPKEMEEIEEGAFFGCSALEEIKIPEGISVINTDVFSNCEGILKIEFPSTLKEIDKEAFWYCTSVKELVIPEGVESIGEKAFYSCDELTKVTLPASLTSVSSDIFEYCTSLETVYVPSGEEAKYEEIFSDRSFEIAGK